MKANELRIGNLVKYNLSNIPQEIKSIISWSQGYCVNFKKSDFANSIDKIQPIPLTEEWILKFGFEKTKKNFCTYDLGKISIYMPSIYYEEGRTYFDGWVIIEKSPKYVHQLQNLYFALTGEELTLKP